MVADYLEGGFGAVFWNVEFSRIANDWMVNDFSAFYSMLYGKVIRRGEVDKLRWRGSKNGVLSVKSLYGAPYERFYHGFHWETVLEDFCSF